MVKIRKIIILIIGIILIIFIAAFLFNNKYGWGEFTYEIDWSTGSATLIKMDSSTEKVEIPSNVSFFKVKKLGQHSDGRTLTGTIYRGIFDGNQDIKELIIPEGVEETYGRAIRNCNNLKKISIPSTMTSFDILGCENLEEINIADGNTAIEHFSFCDSYGLKRITLPERVTSIDARAFGRCSSLKTINIPQKIIGIGQGAFEWCYSLKEIELPKELEYIEYDAFRNCVSLERINIYDKVKKIENNSFANCDKLTIYGVKGSYAEQYAKEHNIPFKEMR